MKKLPKKIINLIRYTRKKSSKAIDIKTLGRTTEDITDNYMSLVDIDILFKMYRLSCHMSDTNVAIPKEELRTELRTLVTDAVNNYIKTREEGLYHSEFVSIYLHKTKSGKLVITLYNNIEI